jgi:hypothetical protein
MATTPSGEADLKALVRLNDVWHELEKLLLKCAGARRITEADEKEHSELLREARVLYGRLSRIIGTAVVAWSGRQFDAFQHILGQSSLSSIISDYNGVSVWHSLWGSAASAIGQAIGRLENQARRGALAPSAEAVARWRFVIRALEAGRRVVQWLLSRPRFLAPVLQRVEGSPLYRLASIITTFAAFIVVAIAIAGGLAVWFFRF